MVGMYCAVFSCKNKLLNRKSSKPNVTFHRFPSDPRLREIWTEFCNRGKDWKKQNVFMCSDHFAPSDFHGSGPLGKERIRTKLVKGALPSRNLPDLSPEPKSVSEGAGSDIVILEVSSIGGKHSTKLIDPPTKTIKVDIHPEDVSPLSRTEDGLVGNHRIRTSYVGSNPLPVLVKQGDASQLMYLHPSPVIKPWSSTPPGIVPKPAPKPAGQVNPLSQNHGVSSDSDACPIPEPQANPGSTGDLLVDRLQQRIRELEGKIMSQRDKYKNKIKAVQVKCSNDLSKLRSRVREFKMEVQRFNRMHTTMLKRGIVPPVSRSKPAQSEEVLLTPSISNEMKRILGRLYTHNQIKAMLNESNLIRWTHSELLNAYTLRHLSYGAYTFVRNSLKFPLPSPKYLTRWLSRIQKEKEVASYSPAIDNGTGQSIQDGESDNDTDELDDLSDSVDVIVEHPTGSICGSEFGQYCEDDEFPNDNHIIIIEGPTCDGDSSSNFEMANQSKEHVSELGVYSPRDSYSRVHRTKQSEDEIVSYENTTEGSDAINEQSCSEGLSEPNLQMDNECSRRFGSIFVVEGKDKENPDSEE